MSSMKVFMTREVMHAPGVLTSSAELYFVINLFCLCLLSPFLNGRALMQNFVQAKQKDQQWSPKIAIKCSKLELLCSACTLTGTNIGRDQYLLYGLPFGILHTTFFTSYCFNLYGSSSSLDMHDHRVQATNISGFSTKMGY